MNKIALFYVLLGFLTQIALAGTHTISISFEQSESALNALIKTQVFPHPVGIYVDGNNEYSYDIYVWNPAIDIEPGIVTFTCTIYADLWLFDEEFHFQYPLSLSLDFPELDVSITGIITFLEGIPEQIENMNGEEWLKDIIIDKYENLELVAYPNKLLNDVNDSIPFDITFNTAGFTWTAEDDLLRFSFYVNTTSNPLTIVSQYRKSGSESIAIRLMPNVPLILRGYKICKKISGQNPEWETDLNVALTPNTYSGNLFEVDFGEPIGEANWICNIYLSSDYGLWIYTCYFESRYTTWTGIETYNLVP